MTVNLKEHLNLLMKEFMVDEEPPMSLLQEIDATFFAYWNERDNWFKEFEEEQE